ncbi:nuclear transport factor 2 family protein [Streptomyces sp. W16]|uniref:ester cyclase n=1 Tax=Streptomyces sp. W16 TaxID=3076631 RepID=UPI00295A5819|nr:nuclear transport factor 2 family protein [Streptomyces sp. W16]MDV9169085.1 nuclear transport factor 2 family protein [Streptomyces sp. W16]
MPRTDNEKRIRSWFDAVNRGDTEAWVGCYTADARSEDIALKSVWRGTEELDAGVREWISAMPDVHAEPEFLFADSESGFAQWTLSGTISGPIGGMPDEIIELAKGKSFSVRGATVYGFSAAGLVRHETLYWNLSDVLTQLGILPPMGT